MECCLPFRGGSCSKRIFRTLLEVGSLVELLLVVRGDEGNEDGGGRGRVQVRRRWPGLYSIGNNVIITITMKLAGS
jgi:hypothetical protein